MYATLVRAQKLNNQELLQVLLSGFTGLLICLLSSAIGNAALVEISVNIVFSAYFGICFIVIGVLLYARVNNIPESSELSPRKNYLQCFSGIVFLSGLLCFFLERDWNQFTGPTLKIPMYIVLGVSLNFTLIFGFIDTIDFALNINKENQQSMVGTPHQVMIILCISSAIGFIYGLLFSAMDIEDIRNFHNLERKLFLEEKICMPIASVLGACGGIINECLRIQGESPRPITMEIVHDPFQEI